MTTELMQQSGEVVAASESASFLHMIERASRDPSVDVDKMERIMAMHERMLSKQAEVAFNTALAEMQTKLPELPENGKIKNKTGQVQSTYVLWEDMNKIIKPILSEHGFSLTFRTGNEGAITTVTGVLRHRQGHSDECTMQLPRDDSGSKNSVQGIGSSTAYGKRYTASALLNLTSRGEDDDGAGGKGMGESTLVNWETRINDCKSIAELEGVWSEATAATTKARDVASHETLRGIVLAKRKALLAEGKK